MNLDGRTVRQVAAGDGNTTHFAKQCLQQDVIILGPERYDVWPDCEVSMRANGCPRTLNVRFFPFREQTP